MDTNTIIPVVLIVVAAIWIVGGIARRREGFRRQVVAEYERIVARGDVRACEFGHASSSTPATLVETAVELAWRLAVATVVANRQQAAVLRGRVGRELHRRGY